ncbi:MAG: hypothetical protein MUP98_19905 [Candidatus Aminicenantes bacterium]|nr:hypothetical protein [Candidatus Aminicenantes bacterium]
MPAPTRTKAKLYKKYPLASLLIYNGTTILHFLLGGFGIIYGYGLTTLSISLGILYLVFAFGEMYVLMPLKVCPSCVYCRMERGLCVSGLNVVSWKITPVQPADEFPHRGKGLLCPNNLYMFSLAAPIIALIPALLMHFSLKLLIVFVALVVLMIFRIFVIFPKIACLHCYAKFQCPQAAQMSVREL